MRGFVCKAKYIAVSTSYQALVPTYFINKKNKCQGVFTEMLIRSHVRQYLYDTSAPLRILFISKGMFVLRNEMRKSIEVIMNTCLLCGETFQHA